MHGLDLLGATRYANVVKSSLPKDAAFGAFSNTFRTVIPLVTRLLEQGKCPAIRIHLDWRDDHKYSLKDFERIVKEATKWKGLVAKYPDVKWYFSGACENNLSAKNAKLLALKILSVLPTVTYVQCGEAKIMGDNIINEVHGSKSPAIKGRYIFSFDGSACVDCDVEKIKQRHKNAELFFFWEPRFNGRWETTDNTMRPLRTGWPSVALVESVVSLVKDKGPSVLPKKWIYKSHAENHGKGDTKAEHPVFICPIKANAIILKNVSGEVLDILPYYGPYAGGGHRYYSKKWGYHIPAVAAVWLNGVCYGHINPAFREGEYRD
jgi:hypothetical protein